MARCGCNAASATTCDAIVLCVAANLGPGLRYDASSGNLAVRFSGDPDNAAGLGSDSGIYVPGGDASVDPTSGRKSVAGLGPRINGATQGGAGGILPWGSPQSIEYGVSAGLDFIAFHSYALADGVAVNRWSSPTTRLSTYTDNPAEVEVSKISSLQLPFLNLDAGTRASPTGRNTGAPSSLLTPNGGWFGFYAQQYTPLTLAQALWQLAARSVAMVIVYGIQEEAQVARNLAAAIQAVVQTLAQPWTLMSVPAYISEGEGLPQVKSPIQDWAADVTGAGIAPMIDLFDEQDPDISPQEWWTPAEVLATGARWVRMQSPLRFGSQDSSRIQEMVDADLNVIVQTSSRQWETAYMYALGARGIMSTSPVYARGGRGEPGDLDYRQTTIPGLVTRTSAEGALTRSTENGIDTRSGEVGYARSSAVGRYFPAQYGWEGGIGAHLHSQLLGELCPFPNPIDYWLRVRFRVDPLQEETVPGVVPKIGVFFGASSDRDITWFEGEDSSHVNGYAVWAHIGTTDQGLVELRKFTNGSSVAIGSAQFPAIAYGNWIYCRIRVTPSGITVTVGHSTGKEDLVISANDTDYRGAYAFYTWEDDYRLPADNQGFYHGYAPYANFQTTQPMYAPGS